MLISVVTVIFLAVIQGFTEFLPVSSSGHLVLAESLLGARGTSASGVGLEVAVHVGTLVAIVVVYKDRIARLLGAFVSYFASGFKRTEENGDDVRYTGLLVLGSVPAAFVGLALRDSIVMLFDIPAVTSLLLVATGFYLLLSKIRRGAGVLTGRSAFIIGLAQAIAILPGCSRSGWTITTAMLLGLGGREAAEFSFLLAIPAILGALALEIAKGSFFVSSGELLLLLLGAAIAFASGWLALRLLLRVMAVGRLHRFAYYLIPTGLAAFIYFSAIR